VDHAVRSAINGHGGMPPRGNRADLTDGELKAAILYMLNAKAPAKAEPKK
jgi:cytochrome c5